MIKQHFYLIGHNPNTVADAKEFLLAGANALEPDIRFDVNDDEYYLSDLDIQKNCTLKDYLDGIKKLITTNKKANHLALLYFDIKEGMNAVIFLDYVNKHFTSTHEACKKVAIMASFSSIDGGGFLRFHTETDQNKMTGICIDQENTPLKVWNFLKGPKTNPHTRIAYGNGIFVAGVDINKHIFRSIGEAKYIQAKNFPHYKMVNVWTLASASSMRDYLNMHVSGIIVNISSVKTLKDILTTETHFSSQYTLAAPGHNPWTTFRPAYGLKIVTRNEGGAGTDSKITFTLHGTKGWARTTVNADYIATMESGETNYCSIEGKDLGEITHLKITSDGAGNGPGWLPKSIRVDSILLNKPVTFKYTEEDWIYHDTPNDKFV